MFRLRHALLRCRRAYVLWLAQRVNPLRVKPRAAALIQDYDALQTDLRVQYARRRDRLDEEQYGLIVAARRLVVQTGGGR
jgi:hypothetical protein